jgi:hypothetical protein
MRFRSLFVVASMMGGVFAGCGGGSGSGATCSKFSACGGIITGSWSVEGACIDNAMALLGGSINQPECAGLISDFRPEASGSYTFNADQTYSSDLKLSYDLELRVTQSCVSAIAKTSVMVSSALCSALQSQFMTQGSPFTSSTCTLEAGGCTCNLVGMENDSMASGRYTLNQTNLVDESDGSSDPFCVTGDSLLQISHSVAGTVFTISLKKS